jgi:hypothetical protein
MKNPFSSPCKALFIRQNAIEWRRQHAIEWRRQRYYVNTFTAFELRPWKLVIFTKESLGVYYLGDTELILVWYSCYTRMILRRVFCAGDKVATL